MKRILIIIPVVLLLVIGGLLISPKVNRFFKERPVKEADLLRMKIIASIINPFDQADTLILDTKWGFCGNSEPDELPVIFDTKLEEEGFRQLLSLQIDKRVLTQLEFSKVMDTVRQVRFHGENPPSLWDSCRVGKVAADITAEQISPKHVRLYESYLYANISKIIQKDFVYDGSNWAYSIIDTFTEVLNK
jgi:hypothetical protein